jgi:hypothetical protein
MNFVCDVHIPYRLVNFLIKAVHQAAGQRVGMTRTRAKLNWKNIEIAIFVVSNKTGYGISTNQRSIA